MSDFEFWFLIVLMFAVPVLYVANAINRFTLKKRYSKRIASCETAEEAFEMRKKYKTAKANCRSNAIILFIIMLVIIVFADMIEGGFSLGAVLKALALAAVYCFMEFKVGTIWDIIFGKLYSKDFIDSVSTYTVPVFMEENKEFILYLRAFETDEYGFSVSKKLRREAEMAKEQGDSTIKVLLSESRLVDALHAAYDMPVGAVGMPREADQPDGSALRIYVDHENWQEDVLTLIKAARAVYVLIASRESCLWEIRQLDQFMEKSVFIIDDIDEFNHTRELLAPDLEWPAIPEDLLAEFSHFVMYRKGNEYIFKPFECTGRGYDSLAWVAVELLPDLPVKQEGLLAAEIEVAESIRNLPVKFEGLFAKLDEMFGQSLADGIDGAGERFNESVKAALPIAVNEQIKIMACESMKGKTLFLEMMLSDDDAESLKTNQQEVRQAVMHRLVTEASGAFMEYCVGKDLLVNFVKSDGEVVFGFNVQRSDIEDLDAPVHLQGNPESFLDL